MFRKKFGSRKKASGEVIRHVLVFHDRERWTAAPANNGGNGPIWQWGNEILTGFTNGKYMLSDKGSHCSYSLPFHSWLARSKDGGETWTAWRPEPYAGQKYFTSSPPGNIDFTGPGFVMRVEGAAYQGNRGRQWFYSGDKGESWQGPFNFGDLLDHEELEDNEFTSRTAYIVDGPGELSLFLTVRVKRPNMGHALGITRKEKTFLARTEDGGKTFSFVSWVVPWDDPYRAAMPAPVRLSPSKIVTAVRRKSTTSHWIDCYETTDNGAGWSFLSKVTDTEAEEKSNGNPPAMVHMYGGRLCCVYGNRTDECMYARCSEDEGKTWSEPQLLRDGFKSPNGFPDFGYPRLFQRPDGKLVTIYSWCSEEKPQTHIEATIFTC